MKCECEVVSYAPALLALTAEEMPRSQIPVRIRDMFGLVYTWVASAPVRRTGQNFAVYDQCTDQALRVRAGFPVSEAFTDTERVKCVELPPGRAARAVHVGAYGEMHRTYDALHAWCAEQGLKMSGVSWEVYGDWSDDPSKLTTEIFVRLREG
jgi:effector-binding domain-containing protein